MSSNQYHVIMELPDSFWSKVQIKNECWVWRAGATGRGYGAAYVNGRQYPAHRLAYSVLRGEIPSGLDLDHLCRNRRCVNPDHLEPVTRRENLLRSPITLTAQKAAQSECIRGHEFTPENTRIRKSDGTRHCRVCQRESERKMKRGQTEKRREYMRQYHLRRKADRAEG